MRVFLIMLSLIRVVVHQGGLSSDWSFTGSREWFLIRTSTVCPCGLPGSLPNEPVQGEIITRVNWFKQEFSQDKIRIQ